MRIVITGASGLVGTALVGRLRELEHDVLRLVRGHSTVEGTSRWDPYAGQLDRQVIEDSDAVIHLSGASIAGGPWTASRKRVLRDSRVITTRLLAETIAQCQRGPQVLLQASAIGYYGDRPGELLTEEASPGSGFLPDVCVAWEAASQAAANAGVRVVLMRTGLVLARHGGFLSKILLPFSLGLGGKIGRGDQMMSWLTLEDSVEMYRFMLDNHDLRGPVNCVAPNPVTNEEFTRQLGKALHRPTLFTVPSKGLRLVIREMADELMLASQNVAPAVLRSAGYRFLHPSLPAALDIVLG